MKIKKRVLLLMITLSLVISTSLIGCDKKEANNNTIKNESVNCENNSNVKWGIW